jgi:hypothetical protein
MLRAGRDLGVEVIWDLCHYGWPDDLDVFSPDFVHRFGRLAGAFARLLADETDTVPLITPINEISFLAWKGGQVGEFNPFALGRGDELKAQLVRAVIEAVEALWVVNRRARVFQIDPLFRVVADPDRPHERGAAVSYTLARYQGWDMLSGRLHPHLGGRPEYVDVIGVNYYPWNQWYYPDGACIKRGHPEYRPLRELLGEVYERYRRPLFLAETSTEGAARPGWLRYVCQEVRAAQGQGVPLGGICLYPVVDFPGWEDERHCPNGLWGYADEAGRREIDLPYAQELRRQRDLFEPAGEEADACPRVLPPELEPVA